VPASYSGGIERVRASVKPARVMPLSTHIAELDRRLATKKWMDTGDVAEGFQHAILDGAGFLKTTRRYERGEQAIEVLFLFPPTYPFSSPVLLRTQLHQPSSHTQELAFGWSLGNSGRPEALADACASVLINLN
jgi:hypothetical protein